MDTKNIIKKKNIIDDIKDGFSYIHVAKKYGVDVDELSNWIKTHHQTQKIGILVKQMRIQPGN